MQSASLDAPNDACLDDIALLQFSSGTTGTPKAVALTHRQIAANVDAIVDSINRDVPVPQGKQRHTVVSWLPLYHDMGLMGCVFGALTDKTTLVLLPPEAFVARPSLWLRAISRHRASVSAAPNFAYSLAAERIRDDELTDVDLSSWALAMNGAEGVSAQSMHTFAHRFSRYGFLEPSLTPVYGLAEATLAVSFSSPKEKWRTLGERRHEKHGAQRESLVSVGRPLANMQVRIVNEMDEAMPEGEVGQVTIDGPSLCQGYWHPSVHGVLARPAGPLRTGDLGLMHAGELYIVGREKDVLIVNGRNHSPEGLEAAANEVAGVRRGCVIAIAVRPWGAPPDKVVLLVETYVRSQRERQRMGQAVGRSVAGHAQVRVDEVVWLTPGTLPRTSSGKLRRHAAREQFENHDLRPPMKFAAVRLWMRYRLRQVQAALPFGRGR